MRKIALLCAGAIALAGMQTAANATPSPYSRSPAPNNQLTGHVTAIAGGVSMSCNIIIIFHNPFVTTADSHSSFNPPLTTDPTHADSPVVQSITMSGGPLGACAAMNFTGAPYPVTVFSGPTGTLPTTSWAIGINGIIINGFGVTCPGNLTATWANGPVSGGAIQAGTLSIPSQMLGPCAISGTLTGNVRIDN